MAHLNDHQNSRIKKQSIPDLERAYRLIVSEEVDLERRLDIVKEIKSRIMIEIEIKLNDRP